MLFSVDYKGVWGILRWDWRGMLFSVDYKRVWRIFRWEWIGNVFLFIEE